MEAVSHIAYLCTQRHYPMYNGSLIYEQQDGETLNTFPRVTVLPALVVFFFFLVALKFCLDTGLLDARKPLLLHKSHEPRMLLQ